MTTVHQLLQKYQGISAQNKLGTMEILFIYPIFIIEIIGWFGLGFKAELLGFKQIIFANNKRLPLKFPKSVQVWYYTQ